MNVCKIRDDILRLDLAVPVSYNKTDYYIMTNKLLQYKWIANNFFVKYNNKWMLANSIDFDF